MTLETRPLVGNPATLRHTFWVSGTPTDATGAVTVTVRKADGSTLASGAAAAALGAGNYEFTLAAQAELNDLTATWAATVAGEARAETSRHPVVGAQLFTLAQARAHNPRRAATPPLADPAAYPDLVLLEARDRITDDFERLCGTSFIPRFRRHTIRANPNPAASRPLLIPDLYLQRVTAAAATGTALTVDELAALTVEDYGAIYHPAGWGTGQVVVEYVHGMPQPPLKVTTAALDELLADQTGDTGQPAGVVSEQIGSYSVRYAAEQLGYPQTVAAVLERYNDRAPVP